MQPSLDSTVLDGLTPIQQEVLKALVEGLSITEAAARGGVHRSTVHLWTRNIPAFAQALLALRQDRAERIVDELGGLADLAISTFRRILNDESAPASVQLKAAMEIAKIAEKQRPTEFAQLKIHQHFDRIFDDQRLAEVAAAAAPAEAETTPVEPTRVSQVKPVAPLKEPVRNAPCPCGSRLKYKRCCGSPTAQVRAA